MIGVLLVRGGAPLDPCFRFSGGTDREPCAADDADVVEIAAQIVVAVPALQMKERIREQRSAFRFCEIAVVVAEDEDGNVLAGEAILQPIQRFKLSQTPHAVAPAGFFRIGSADDELAYWISSGFETDGENGASGTASFKAEGVSGMTKSLSQTVYPANRDSYTISAQIASEDLEKLSSSSQVGIEVVIEYEDGTTETRFIDLY